MLCLLGPDIMEPTTKFPYWALRLYAVKTLIPLG